jgi:beta-lactamase superfamily II metal-dependent hydrolase
MVARGSLFSRNVILYASAQTAEVVNRSSPPLTVGDLSLTVLNPPIWHFGHVNDDSIVLSFTYGQVSFLLMGDAEATAENDLDESNSLSLNAFVLKVGHHGSSSPSSSSTAGFLRDVQPHVAVVSDDGTHADQCVLSTLAEYAVVYETWRDGTVTLWTDGIGYCVSTSLGTATACSGECADCGPRGSL